MYTMRLLLISAFALSANAATIPDTLLGRIGAAWAVAINTGAEGPLREFVAAHMSANALHRDTADGYVSLFRKLQEQSGGIEIIDVADQRPDRPMVMLVKSRRGDRYARVMLGLDETEREKLAGMGISRAEAPVAEREKLWPRSKVSEKEMIAAIRNRVDACAAEGSFSGVVLVARENHILLHVARGMADREASIPNTLDTKFHLASVGKMFTAAAIAQLVRAGKLRFEDTIASVMPDYPNRDVAKKVTIHQLLTHTAGFGTFFESPGYVRGKKYRTSAEEIEVFKDEPLFFEPGTSWRYSNAGYSLLGAIIERVSGEEYGEYVRHHIFEPLGMNATGSRATFYTQSDQDPLGLDPFVADRSWEDLRRTGFGDGYSNARDLFRFVRALRTGALLGREMTGVMINSRVDEDGAGSGSVHYAYALVERTINGSVVRGHTGGGRVDVEMVWDRGYTVIVLQNAIPPTAGALGDEIVGFITKQR